MVCSLIWWTVRWSWHSVVHVNISYCTNQNILCCRWPRHGVETKWRTEMAIRIKLLPSVTKTVSVSHILWLGPWSWEKGRLLKWSWIRHIMEWATEKKLLQHLGKEWQVVKPLPSILIYKFNVWVEGFHNFRLAHFLCHISILINESFFRDPKNGVPQKKISAMCEQRAKITLTPKLKWEKRRESWQALSVG